MPSNVQVYIVGVDCRYIVRDRMVVLFIIEILFILLIDVNNSKRLEHMTVKAMKTACAVCRSGRSIFFIKFQK